MGVKSEANVKKRAAEGGSRMRTPSHLQNNNAARLRGELQKTYGHQASLRKSETELSVYNH